MQGLACCACGQPPGVSPPRTPWDIFASMKGRGGVPDVERWGPGVLVGLVGGVFRLPQLLGRISGWRVRNRARAWRTWCQGWLGSEVVGAALRVPRFAKAGVRQGGNAAGWEFGRVGMRQGWSVNEQS